MLKASQYAKRVNVVKYAKINDKWRFAPVLQKNGEIVRDQVRINGSSASHPEASYYIEWRENGIRRREPVSEFAEVVDRARRKLIELEAMKEGIIEAKPVEIKETHIRVEDAITKIFAVHRRPPQEAHLSGRLRSLPAAPPS